MKPIWIIDFDDSFTYNIASEPHTLVPKLLILGPGPGHPDEYKIESILLEWWKTQVPIVGLCLGHQFIARFLGLNVERSHRPIHGEAIRLKTPPYWREHFRLPSQLEVQRYNSLAVKAKPLPSGWKGWEHEGEWISFSHKRAISYQFHPESVGTSCPEALFQTMTSFTL